MPWYNEIDPFASRWLEQLAASDLIAPGPVETRSIAELIDTDIPDGQAHFFAGIGGWSLALRWAGVPDDVEVWTGSCPCQPFSSAGARRGTDDHRHLWPEWRRLVAERRPPILFGEQVASAPGRAWLASVRTDLEALGYRVGSADLCAASVGAPHMRQRVFFGAVRLGDSGCKGLEGLRPDVRVQQGIANGGSKEIKTARTGAISGIADSGGSSGDAVDLADTDRRRREVIEERDSQEERRSEAIQQGSNADRRRDSGTVHREEAESARERIEDRSELDEPGNTSESVVRMAISDGRECNRITSSEEREPDGQAPGWEQGNGKPERRGPWDGVEWLPCSDGKARPTQPGIEPLAYGIPGRVGKLRGYGNAIVPQVAAQFIGAFLEALEDVGQET